MERRYKDLCKDYDCKAKVFTTPQGIKNKIGSPDMIILFTNTVSHKMIHMALTSVDQDKAVIVRSHSSSMASLKEILSTHVS